MQLPGSRVNRTNTLETPTRRTKAARRTNWWIYLRIRYPYAFVWRTDFARCTQEEIKRRFSIFPFRMLNGGSGFKSYDSEYI